MSQRGESQFELPPVLRITGDGVAFKVDGPDPLALCQLIDVCPVFQLVVVELQEGRK